MVADKTLRLPAKNRQRVQFADDQPVPADCEVGPGRGIADLELAERRELFRVGFDEVEDPLLVES
jgi:hypothetical protein